MSWMIIELCIAGWTRMSFSYLYVFLQLNLGDAALRMEVNLDAVKPPFPSAARVHAGLQDHIAKLQVREQRQLLFWWSYVILPFC